MEPTHVILMATAGYGLCFALLNTSHLLNKLIPDAKQRIDVLSRLVSVINVSMCLWSAFNLHASHRALLHDHFPTAFGSDVRRERHLCLLAGYLLYDVLLLVVYRAHIWDTQMLVHHCVIFTAIVVSIHMGVASFYISVLLINEASTPFLTLRYILLSIGRADSRLYLVNGVLLFLSFFVFRVLAISLLVLHGAQGWWELGVRQGMLSTIPAVQIGTFVGLSVLLLAHWLLNLIWFAKIWAHARRVLMRVDSGGLSDDGPRQRINPKRKDS
jgi:hypothetical protein